MNAELPQSRSDTPANLTVGEYMHQQSKQLKQDVDSCETLFELADRAMYKAKAAGRNQTQVARFE